MPRKHFVSDLASIQTSPPHAAVSSEHSDLVGSLPSLAASSFLLTRFSADISKGDDDGTFTFTYTPDGGSKGIHITAMIPGRLSRVTRSTHASPTQHPRSTHF